MKRFSVILLAAAVSGGCVNTSAPKPQAPGSFQTETVEQRQAQLTPVKSWNASGAISIQRAQQSPMIMRYEWRQSGPSNYRVDLAASLNLAAVTITGHPGRVTLQRDRERPVSAATPEQLMQQNLGWSLPVPSLWYWARGLPAPGPTQETKYDSYGHLTLLRQNGWQAKFDGYHTVQGVDLPHVIELHRQDISARIVVKQWQIVK
jgi:outer membrane lipoprotein LolB